MMKAIRLILFVVVGTFALIGVMASYYALTGKISTIPAGYSSAVVRDTVVRIIHDTIVVEKQKNYVEKPQNNNDKDVKPAFEHQVLNFLETVAHKSRQHDPELPEFVRSMAGMLAHECRHDMSLRRGLEALYMSKSGEMLTDHQIEFIARKIDLSGLSIIKLKKLEYGHY